jgi:death on curing protein
MSSIVFLSVQDVMDIHERVIMEFGGDLGLRDRGLLESAVAMPGATFSGSFLHPGVAEMAGAYHFHLCSNHTFIDGNKRVAVASAEVFLLLNGFELSASDDELEGLTMELAMGKISKEQVIEFFKKHTEEV